MKIADYIQYDGLGLAELIKQRAVTAQELLETAIKLMELTNPAINAVVNTFYDKAQQQIKNVPNNTLFAGVPALLKDSGFAYQGTIETCGSRYLATNKTDYNNDFVNKLLDNGFIIFGRTHTPELGLSYASESSLFGPCRNPWALNRTSGGSSAGSAAAVASRIVPVATATDGGGSIRIPAACCGLFGLKPTRGNTPCGPKLIDIWSGLATAHVLTRSVRDSAAVLDLMLPPEFKHTIKPSMPSLLQAHKIAPEQLKIAVLTGAFAPVPIENTCQQALSHACKLLQDLGHTIEPVEIKINLEAASKSIITIIAAHTKAELDVFRSIMNKDYQPDDIEPITREFAEIGQHVNASDLIIARHALYQEIRPVIEAFAQYDVLLTPALAQLPVALGELNPHDKLDYFNQKNIEFSPFTALFNHTGHPAMTLPVYWTAEGLPVSIQCAATYGDELTLLRLAAQIEEVQPWVDKRPEILNKLINY